MTAETKDGKLIVTIQMEKEPRLSATGKTLVVASSRGNQPTAVQVDGQNVVIGH